MPIGSAKAFPGRAQRRSAGFSYIEVMIAAALIALALVPAIEALVSGVDSASAHETLTIQHYRAQARLADLQGETFEALDMAAQAVADPAVPTTYSDTAGTPMRRLVYLSRYDFDASPPEPDPTAGYGVLWMRVSIEGAAHGFEMLRAR